MKRNVIISIYVVFILIISVPAFGYLKGDVNNDNKIGLTEAVHALQVTGGIRTTTASATINVKKDGSGDFTTIQEAVDAASDGDTINIGAGTFQETLNVQSKKLWLVGAGMDNTIIKGSGSNSEDVVIFAIDSSGRISGLSVTDGKNGLEISCSRFQVYDCKFTNNNIGIYARDNSTMRINHTISKNNTDGVQIAAGSTAVVENNCEFSNNSYAGIFCRYSSIAQISSSTFTNNYAGIFFEFSSSGTVVDCTVNDTSGTARYGIEAYGGSDIWIQNTTVSNYPAHGVFIMSGSSGSLAGNTIENCGEMGVLAYISSTVRLFGGNKISGNTRYGVCCYMNSSADIVLDTRNASEKDHIFSNKESGLCFDDSSTGLIESAIIKENAQHGVIVWDNSNCVINSDVSIHANLWGIVRSQNSVYTVPKWPNPLIDFGTNDTKNKYGAIYCADCTTGENDFDGDGWISADDCNDGNPHINPGAQEISGDGIDSNCDGNDNT